DGGVFAGSCQQTPAEVPLRAAIEVVALPEVDVTDDGAGVGDVVDIGEAQIGVCDRRPDRPAVGDEKRIQAVMSDTYPVGLDPPRVDWRAGSVLGAREADSVAGFATRHSGSVNPAPVLDEAGWATDGDGIETAISRDESAGLDQHMIVRVGQGGTQAYAIDPPDDTSLHVHGLVGSVAPDADPVTRTDQAAGDDESRIRRAEDNRVTRPDQ